MVFQIDRGLNYNYHNCCRNLIWWATIDNLQEGYTAIKEGYSALNQVIDSQDFKEGSELGQDLAGEGLEFLGERYENYKSNNPEEFP